MNKKRCFHCNKKIKGLVIHTCKCEKKVLCVKCRLPENHNCTYDIKKEQKVFLKEKLVKIEYQKVVKI